MSLVLSVLFLLLVCAVLAWCARSEISWTGWPVPSCYPACFCEAFRPGPVVQPQSSYSCLFIVLVGLTIINLAHLPLSALDGAETLSRHRMAFSSIYGALVVCIGLFSLFYHLSLTLVGQYLDYVGMYLLASFVLLYRFTRLRALSQKQFAWVFLALNALLIVWLIVRTDLRRVPLAGLLVGAGLLEILVVLWQRPTQIRFGYLCAGLVCSLIGLTANLLDESDAWCRPDRWWQWHAFWHALMAAGIGFFYLYLRSEVVPDERSRIPIIGR